MGVEPILTAVQALFAWSGVNALPATGSALETCDIGFIRRHTRAV